MRAVIVVAAMGFLFSGCEDQAAAPAVTSARQTDSPPQAAVAPSGAGANVGVPLPARPKGGGWSRLTSFGAETDSICIGNGRSATCAVETYLACIARRDNALCAIAQNDPKLASQFEPSERRRIFDYRFRRLGPFTRKDLPADLDVDWRPASGDQLAVVDVVECVLDGGWQCRPFTGPQGHFVYLKRVGGLWYVKDSYELPN